MPGCHSAFLKVALLCGAIVNKASWSLVRGLMLISLEFRDVFRDSNSSGYPYDYSLWVYSPSAELTVEIPCLATVCVGGQEKLHFIIFLCKSLIFLFGFQGYNISFSHWSSILTKLLFLPLSLRYFKAISSEPWPLSTSFPLEDSNRDE